MEDGIEIGEASFAKEVFEVASEINAGTIVLLARDCDTSDGPGKFVCKVVQNGTLLSSKDFTSAL